MQITPVIQDNSPSQPTPVVPMQATQPIQAPTVQQPAQAPQNVEETQEPLKAVVSANIQHKNTVTMAYDNLAGITVLKSFDGKGNVVSQTPPAQALKTLELEGGHAEDTKGINIKEKV